MVFFFTKNAQDGEYVLLCLGFCPMNVNYELLDTGN